MYWPLTSKSFYDSWTTEQLWDKIIRHTSNMECGNFRKRDGNIELNCEFYWELFCSVGDTDDAAGRCSRKIAFRKMIELGLCAQD